MKTASVIRPKSRVFELNLKEIWHYRDLISMFVKRDIVILYKQTILGPLWNVIQPAITVAMYMLVFGGIAGIPTEGIPQPLFYLSGVCMWQYFADCLTKTSNSFASNASLYSKVYFPRLICPISAVLSNLFRFCIQLLLFVTVYLCYAFLGTELPLTVTQMLWVNLIMDTFAAMALASIPPSADVMNEKPRKTNDFIISKPMRYNILGVAGCFLVVLMTMIWFIKQLPATEVPVALTIFFTVFVMLQFWNLFNASVFGTNHSVFKDARHAVGMVSVAVIILIGQFMIVEFGGKVFRTVPLDWMQWVGIIGGTSVVLWIGEITRWVKRLKSK